MRGFWRHLEISTCRHRHPQTGGHIAEPVQTYADFPLGTTDAPVIAAAERLDAETVCTLDRRHFAAVRPRHRDAFAPVP